MSLRKWMYLNDRILWKALLITLGFFIGFSGGTIWDSHRSWSNLHAAEAAVREYRFAKRKATVIHKGCFACFVEWTDLVQGFQKDPRLEPWPHEHAGRRIIPRDGDSAEKRRIDVETALRVWKAGLKAKDDEERRKRLNALRRDLVELGVFEK